MAHHDWTVDYYRAHIGDLTSGDTVTLQDSASALQALSAGDFAQFVTDGGFVTVIDSTSDALSLSADQFLAAIAVVSFDPSDFLTLYDTGANISLLTTTQLDSLVTAGVAAISSSSGAIQFLVSQFNHLGTMAVDGAATFKIADTGVNLGLLTADEIGAMAAAGVDQIDSTTNTLTLSADQFNALNAPGSTITLTASDTVTLKDTGANIAGQSTSFFSGLSAKGIDFLEASDTNLTLAFAKFTLLGSVALRPANVVTVTGTSTEILSRTFSAYNIKNVDYVNVTNGDASHTISLSAAQTLSLTATNVKFDATSVVTLSDTGAAIAALDADGSVFAKLATSGVDIIDASDTNLTLLYAQFANLGTTALTGTDNVTVSGTAANILGTTFATYDTKLVDTLHTTTNASLSVVQAANLAGATVVFDGASNVVVAVPGSDLTGLNLTQLGALHTHGVDSILAAGALSVTVDQFGALNGVTLTGTDDTLTVADQSTFDGLNIANVHAAGLEHIACAGALTIDTTKFGTLTSNSITLTGSNDTISITQANVSGANLDAWLAAGIEHVSGSNLTFTFAEFGHFGSMTLTGTNNTISIAQANISTANLDAWSGSGFAHVTGTDLTLTVTEFSHLGTMTLTGTNDTISIAQPNISNTNLDAWATAGFEHVTGTDLTFTVDQAGHLGTMTLTGTNDTISIAQANISGANLDTWAAAGFEHVTGTDLTFTVDEAGHLGTMTLTGTNDTISIAQANISGTNLDTWATAGFEHVSGTNLTFTVAEFGHFGTMTATGTNDTISIAQANISGANLDAWATAGFEHVTGTDLVFTVAEASHLSTMTLTGTNDTLSVADQTAFDGLTFANVINAGFEHVSCTSNLEVSVTQFGQLGALTLTGADFTLVVADDTEFDGLTLANVPAAGIGQVYCAGALTLTTTQFTDLGIATLNGTDDTLLVTSQDEFNGLTLATVANRGIEHIESSVALNVSASQYAALDTAGTVTLTGTDDTLVVADQAAFNLLTLGDVAAVGIENVACTGALAITTAKFADVAGASLKLTGTNDTITVVQGDISTANLDAWLAAGIEHVAGTGLTLTVAEFSHLGTMTLTGTNDTISIAQANISNTNLDAWAAAGFEHVTGTDLTFSATQFLHLGTMTLTGTNDTISIAQGDISTTNLDTWAAAGIEHVTGASLTFTVDQAGHLGTMTLTGPNDTISIAQANISGTNLDTWATAGFEHVSGTNLTFTVAEFGHFGTMTATGTNDTISIAQANISGANLDAWATAGFEHVTGTDLVFTVAEASHLSTMTLTGTNDTLSVADQVGFNGLNFTNVINAGFEQVSCTSDLDVSVTQFGQLGALTLTGADFTLVVANDTEFDGLTLTNVPAAGIGHVSCAGALTLTTTQFTDLGTAMLDGANDTLLVTSQDEFNGLTLATVASRGIEHIESSVALNVSASQYAAISLAGTMTLTGSSDTLVVADQAAFDLLVLSNVHAFGIENISCASGLTMDAAFFTGTLWPTGLKLTGTADTLTVTNQAGFDGLNLANLATAGIDRIQCGGALIISASTLTALGTMKLAGSNDSLTIADQAAFNGLDVAAVAAAGIEHIIGPASLTINAAKVGTLTAAGVSFDSSIAVTLADTGAAIAALDISLLSTNGVDTINASDGAITLTAAQYAALGSVTIDNGDTLTINGTSDRDEITGRAGPDVLNGLGGNDVLTGGGGSDTLDGGLGNDVLDGGTGTDTVTYATAGSAVNVDLGSGLATGGAGTDILANIENVIGSNYNDTIVGDGGNNVLSGGAGADILRPGSGVDTVNGGNGDDTISFTGGRLIAADVIDGGAGTDTVWLNGDYAAGNAVTFNATTLTNVEKIGLGVGFNYNLTTADATVASGQMLTLDATNLGASNSVNFNGAAETNGTFMLIGGAGADTLAGGSGNDVISGRAGNDILRAGWGSDMIYGGDGDDTISFSNGKLNAADVVDGGAGTDMVYLNGDYSGANAVVFNYNTITNVETIALAASFSYGLTTADATVASGQSMFVDGSGLGAGQTLTFNGAAETNGSFVVMGGAGADLLTGGAGNDTLSGRAGNDTLRAGMGNDVVKGGDGDDTISFTGGRLNAVDIVDGGTGLDTVWLNGDYTGANAVTFNATTVTNVESIGVAGGFNYNLKSADATVGAGKWMIVDGSNLGTANTLTFNGSAETNGTFIFVSGSGGDTFTGGSGADTFKYDAATRSTGLHYDTINALNFANDTFDIPGGVGVITGIDAALTTGTLSTASIETDLTAALAGLGAHHAQLFTANAGTLSGQTFMVVDCNGLAGYQAGQDLVVRLNGYSGTLAAGAFH